MDTGSCPLLPKEINKAWRACTFFLGICAMWIAQTSKKKKRSLCHVPGDMSDMFEAWSAEAPRTYAKLEDSGSSDGLTWSHCYARGPASLQRWVLFYTTNFKTTKTYQNIRQKDVSGWSWEYWRNDARHIMCSSCLKNDLTALPL